MHTQICERLLVILQLNFDNPHTFSIGDEPNNIPNSCDESFSPHSHQNRLSPVFFIYAVVTLKYSYENGKLIYLLHVL